MFMLRTSPLVVAGGRMHGLAYALIGAASTDVGHGSIDVGIAGFGCRLRSAAAAMIWPV